MTNFEAYRLNGGLEALPPSCVARFRVTGLQRAEPFAWACAARAIGPGGRRKEGKAPHGLGISPLPGAGSGCGAGLAIGV